MSERKISILRPGGTLRDQRPDVSREGESQAPVVPSAVRSDGALPPEDLSSPTLL